MENSPCENWLQTYQKISEFGELGSSYIANAVFNMFLSFTAIMLNVVTIHAIRKTSSLSKTLKTLLLSLAVCDVGVGLFVQPFYTSLLVKWLRQNNPECTTYMAYGHIHTFYCVSSFFGVVAISVDRFVAIHFHLRYQELVTHKRVVAVVISIWVLGAFLSLMSLWVPPNIVSSITFILLALGFVLTTMAYIRIYLAVRHQKIQIQSLQVQQGLNTGEIATLASHIKSAVGVFYVYLLYFICYLPSFVLLVALTVRIAPSIPLKRLYLFSNTLMYLNSSLNPVIYCWKMRHIRHALMDILRNMLALYRNRGSHWRCCSAL